MNAFMSCVNPLNTHSQSICQITPDNVAPVNSDETAESLWGADKGDPKDALAENGFKMKRIVLTRPPGGLRPRGRRHGGGGGGKKKSSE
jgi:hypothetical protein